MPLPHAPRLTAQKIADRLALIVPQVARRRAPLPPFRYTALPGPTAAAPVGVAVDDSAWPQVAPHSYWGAWRTDFVLRTTLTVPSDWPADAPVALDLPLGVAGDGFSHPEALIYIDGQRLAAVDRHHHQVLLPGHVRDGQPHTLALHGWTGHDGWPSDPALKTQLYMRPCAVVQWDAALRAFVGLARAALQAALAQDEHAPARARLLTALDAAFLALDTRDPLSGDALCASAPAALGVLREGLAGAGDPLDVTIVGVGHAHIDVAWLWPLAQTHRKASRTFSNVLHLMHHDPAFTFSQSQPYLYRAVQQDDPALFAEVQQRVAEGRWEPLGGTWVEPDCNCAGAEALVRQFLLGRGAFRRWFGPDADTPTLWLPDTFGFPWTLPQLARQAGMTAFVTSKLSWNQSNRIPHQLFWWQGLDGTRLLTHFLSTPVPILALPFTTTYNGAMTADEVLGTWRMFAQKEAHDTLLTAYGYGDGGGGPTYEMLENAHAFAAMPGMPRVTLGTVRAFIDEAAQQAADALPTWNDELYLELHRGTLTSQARAKWHNRKSEVLLHDAELVAALAHTVSGHAYPHAALTEAWELVCLNQFHDILPGSSVTAVYEDALRDYARVHALAEPALAAALDALGHAAPPGTVALALNATPFPQQGALAHLPGGLPTALADLRDGTPLAAQPHEDGVLVALPPLPALSVLALGAAPTDVAPPQLTQAATVTEHADGSIVLENALLRATLASDGTLHAVYDKQAARAVLAAGLPGNQLLAMEDRPVAWDAWDIDIFHEDRTEVVGGLAAMHVVARGPLRAAVRLVRHYRASTIVQDVALTAFSQRLDFTTTIDWHEQHTLLKVAFPVEVLAPRATYHIQWGHIERPTHRNTAWDWARFEVAAHHFVDLSEADYGVALLNDCKYGHDVHGNVLRLSLLKSATMPDPTADQGRHTVTYSLLPHSGGWRDGVPAEGALLNDPVRLHALPGGAGTGTDAPACRSVVAGPRAAVVETVKRAEDSDGLILRLYEAERTRGPVALHFGFDVASVQRCTLLEGEDTAEGPGVPVLADDRRTVTLFLRPYEVVTLRVRPAVAGSAPATPAE